MSEKMLLTSKFAKTFFAAAMGLSLSLSCCGCSLSGNGDAQTDENTTVVIRHSEDNRKLIGISMPTQSLERWNHDGTYLKAALEERGYEVDLRFSSYLIDSQIDAISEMIDEGCDVLIIAAVDSTSLSHVLENAAEQEIPVVAYDRLIRNSENVTAYVSFDNYEVGRLQGEFIRDNLNLSSASGQTFHIEFTSGDSVDNNAKYFFDGAYDVLAPYLESGVLKVLSGQDDFYSSSTSQWSTGAAESRFEIILSSYYNKGERLDAAVCSNDSTALGVIHAIEKSYTGSNRVLVTGQDCDIANMALILDGTQSMSVYKNLNQEAVATVSLVDSIFRGAELSKDMIKSWNLDYPCVFDTESYHNGRIAVPSFLLQPVSITSENAEEELVNHYQTYQKEADGLLHPVE